jgi:23S rRNA (cytosine1962-C5)-methyltransferase
LNAFGNHEVVTGDVFDFLKSDDRDHDIVVLDPPAFAKHLSALDKAVIGYRNLNLAGFRKVRPGGLLFTYSCSQVIDKSLFRKVVFQAAAQSGRNVRILHQLSQGPDHPVSIYHPEGEYLKGLVLHVE